MKKPFLLNLLVLAVSLAILSVGSGLFAETVTIDKIKFPGLNKFELPQISQAQINNGIKLRVIKSEKLPLIDLYVLVKGGEAYEPTAKVGLAYAAARLLRIGGTSDLQPDQLDQLLDAKGISLGINAETDYFLVTLSCLEENLAEAVSILARILQQPAFDPDKLAEIKTQLGSLISRRNDSPAAINAREFSRLIYGQSSPFASVLEYEHIEAVTRDDVNAFYKTFFAPDNMLVGIIGPVEIDEVKAIFEEHLGDWRSSARIPAYPVLEEPQHDFKVAFAEKSNLNQSFFSIGHLGIKEDTRDVKEKARIMLFNSIFAQGFSSRLNTRVRVKMGLTYALGGGIITEYLYPGKTFISTFTKSATTIEAIRAIFDEIKLIREEKVSPQELEDARDWFLNSFVFRFSSPANILLNALTKEFYGIDADFEEKLIESIKTVSADDLLKTAQKYLHPEKMIIFIVGKGEDISGDLSELGKVKKIDIAIPSPPIKETIPPATEETLNKGRQIMDRLAKGKYRGYTQLKSLEIHADRTMTLGGRTLPIKTRTIGLYPHRSYTEMSLMGMKMEYIIDGDRGVVKQMGQSRPLSKEQIEENRFGSLYDLFNARGKYKFQYLEEVEIAGKRYDVIYTFDAKKNWLKLFINKETHLIEVEERLSKMPGQSGIAREIKSDFKTIGTIPIAHKSETYIKDKKIGQATITQVKVNQPIDKTLFDF